MNNKHIVLLYWLSYGDIIFINMPDDVVANTWIDEDKNNLLFMYIRINIKLFLFPAIQKRSTVFGL